MYQLYFQQTAHERYETDMNASVRELLKGAGIPIVEEFGGIALNLPSDELVGECGFVVDTSLERLRVVADAITAAVGRHVEVTENRGDRS
jgi:hypothetical protein